MQGVDELSLGEAHSIYGRNKHFLDFENIGDSDQELIRLLKLAFEGVVL